MSVMLLLLLLLMSVLHVLSASVPDDNTGAGNSDKMGGARRVDGVTGNAMSLTVVVAVVAVAAAAVVTVSVLLDITVGGSVMSPTTARDDGPADDTRRVCALGDVMLMPDGLRIPTPGLVVVPVPVPVPVPVRVLVVGTEMPRVSVPGDVHVDGDVDAVLMMGGERTVMMLLRGEERSRRRVEGEVRSVGRLLLLLLWLVLVLMPWVGETGAEMTIERDIQQDDMMISRHPLHTMCETDTIMHMHPAAPARAHICLLDVSSC